MTSIDLAVHIRAEAIKMVARAGGSHLGGALSMADILAVLYSEVMDVDASYPAWPERDRFILSKGHCCSALYAALAIKGFIPRQELETYGANSSRLMPHVSHKVPGVEFSTGSLGHGLPFACGKALAAKRQRKEWRTYVVVSDGELDEGSNWEAILFAPQQSLDNLVLIVDYNRIQSLGNVCDVMDLHPLADKFKAFRWGVCEVDGHDHEALKTALKSAPWHASRPSCLIAHTVKGKGVDFMEGQLRWHYASPSGSEVASAMAQLGQPS